MQKRLKKLKKRTKKMNLNYTYYSLKFRIKILNYTTVMYFFLLIVRYYLFGFFVLLFY